MGIGAHYRNAANTPWRPPLLLALAGLLSWRRCGRYLIALAILIQYLASTPYVAARLTLSLQDYPPLLPDTLASTPAQAIVVLGGDRYRGGPEYGGDTAGPRLLERLRYAAWLHKRTGLPVIPSGGSREQEVPQGQLAREVLEQEFQVQVLAVEPRSRTTRENSPQKNAVDRFFLFPTS